MFLLLPSATGQGSNQAEDISIEDTEDAFTADNVEDALFELANRTASDIPFDSAEFAGVLSGLQDNVIQTALAALDGIGSPISFTPLLTATSTNPTPGTGANLAGYYTQIGKRICGEAFIFLGTSPDAGEGIYRLELPVPHNVELYRHSSTAGNGSAVGIWTGLDASFPRRDTGYLQLENASHDLARLVINGDAGVSDSAPWVWGDDDVITFQFAYWAA